jgi:hypothetical protein
MAKSKRKVGNTRGPVRKTGPGKLIGVRCLPPLLKRIDAWAKDQDDKPTRPDAMRRLIERGLGA